MWSGTMRPRPARAQQPPQQPGLMPPLSRRPFQPVVPRRMLVDFYLPDEEYGEDTVAAEDAAAEDFGYGFFPVDGRRMVGPRSVWMPQRRPR